MIVVIEEAQSVLGKYLEESSPFVEWVKEGRKYDLGAIMITQQPGSMAPEIMSQSDNWFAFHLLSEGDASTLGRYNSHYSHDVLSHIIGEPIPGNCYMWSAPKQPFVLPVRVRNFEELYGTNVKSSENEPAYQNPPAKIFREKANQRFKELSEALYEIMKKNKLSIHEFEDDTIGIYYGQLFYLIQEVKKLEQFKDEIRKEDQLYEPVLSNLFNCKVIIQKGIHSKAGESDFYCVPKTKWIEKFPS